MEFSGVTGHEVYAGAAAAVHELGIERSPRGMKTYDLGQVTLTIANPIGMLPLGTRPNISTNLAAVEAIQLIGGFSDPDLIRRVAPQLLPYAEDTGVFHGAYGKRTNGQIAKAIAKLSKDPDTRQAIVTIWDPTLDNLPEKRDYPCTVSLAFEIRANMLNLTAFMRSSDLWKGLPYDMFQFSQLQQTVARVLQRPCGFFRLITLSLHAYHEDLTDEKLFAVNVQNARNDTLPYGVGDDLCTSWFSIQQRALNLKSVLDPTESEKWYLKRLYPTQEIATT